MKLFLGMAALIVTVMAIDTLAAYMAGMPEPREQVWVKVGGGR